MELRKDPITRSWVVAGHPEREKVRPDPCPLCPENRIETQTLLALPPARHVAGAGVPAFSAFVSHRRRSGAQRRRHLRPHGPGRRARNHRRDAGPHAHARAAERRGNRARAGSLGAAHRGLEARRAIQIRDRVQESRRAVRRGVAARAFAGHRDDVRSAAHSVRTALGARMVSRPRALRFLRHSAPGNAAGQAHRGQRRRLSTLFAPTLRACRTKSG